MNLPLQVNPKPPVNFLDIPRCCMTGKEQTVCRFQQIESRWGYSGTSDRIRWVKEKEWLNRLYFICAYQLSFPVYLFLHNMTCLQRFIRIGKPVLQLDIHTHRFIVDRRIFVVGFGMYGSIHGPSEYEVTIQIIHTATGKVNIAPKDPLPAMRISVVPVTILASVIFTLTIPAIDILVTISLF